MTRIESIYQRVYHELQDSRPGNEELNERIKTEIESMNCPLEEKERLSEAMFIGSAYRQSGGFAGGFRFAMALIFESLT